jgi:serpin B
VGLTVRRIAFRPAVRDSVTVAADSTVRVDLTITNDYWPTTPPNPARDRAVADSGASGAFRGADTGSRTTYTGFSLRLFRQVARGAPNANIFLSPASAGWALAMTAGGAAHGTWREMARVLGVDAGAPDALGPTNGAELASLAKQSGVELHVANSIWASAGRPFLPAFLDGARRWYGAEVTSMVLHGTAPLARINAWVSRATSGKIPAIFDDTLPDAETMVLINAVYFHGRWRNVFDSAATRPHRFTLPDGSIVSRPLMVKSERFLYLRDSGFQAVRLPYQGGRLAMYVFLPDSGARLATFEAKLDSARWARWMHAFRPGEPSVIVELPKFRLEYQASLIPPLQALGMTAAFDRKQADFSRMMPAALLRDSNVYVNQALQRTYLDVNEQGTEAAAATGIGMQVVTGAASIEPIRFIVDRPFCVAIRDDRTGLILFLGQIADPPAP